MDTKDWLECMYYIATTMAATRFTYPWIARKLKVWWNKTRLMTEFTLGCKAEVGSKTSSQEYEIGYLFISYETTYKKKWSDWKFRTLHSLYSLNLIDKLPKFGSVAHYRSINNSIRFDRERQETGEGADSYIYQNTKALAFYSIEQFAQAPKWTDSPYTEKKPEHISNLMKTEDKISAISESELNG